MTDRPLTGKQQAFVNAYIACGFNATEAARRAGYSGDDSALRARGAENVANRNIRSEIDKLLSAQVMSRDEVLTRLSDHARASLEDFMDDKQVLDLEAAKKRGKLHLAKKIKETTRRVRGDPDATLETLEIELHDPQAALVQLGRHYRLFVDRVEIEVPAEILKLLPDVLRAFGTVERASEAFRRLVQEADKAQQPAQVTPEGGADV